MTSNHTPGPWQVVNGSDVFTRIGARNAAGVKAADNDGWYIADCDMGPSSTGEGEADIPYAEKRANARLIAAAPELLDVLGDALSLLDEIDSAVRAEHRNNGAPQSKSVAGIIAERARAAIAKARGETC